MRNPLALLAGAALCLSSCQKQQTSSVWRQVVEVPHPGGDTMDSSRAYAADLHRVLLQARVPHKIVSVSFAFRTDYTPSGNTQRTLVVYQDTTARQASWWVMDERLNVPVWLPDKPLEQQVSFYLARPVTVLEVSDYTNLTDGKSVIPLETGAPPSGTTQIEPVTPRVVESARPRSGGKKSPKAEMKPAVAPKPAAKPRTGASPKAMDAAESAPKARSTEAVAKRPAAVSFGEDISLPKKEITAKKPVAEIESSAPAEAKSAPEKSTKTELPKTAAPTGESKPGPGAEKKKNASAAQRKDAKLAAKKEAFPEQPELAAEKPEPAVEKPVSPAAPHPSAVRAKTSEKPAAKPALIDKADPTPQATVLPEGGEKKAPAANPKADQATEPPKLDEPPKTRPAQTLVSEGVPGLSASGVHPRAPFDNKLTIEALLDLIARHNLP